MRHDHIFRALSSLRLASAAFVTAVLVCCAARTFAQSPVPKPVVMPNVAVITASPLAFQSFTVKADFSKAYCFSDDYPLYSNISLKAGVLSVILSHLRLGPCVTTKSITLPGIPAGEYTLRLSVTGDDSGGIQVRRTYEAEVGQTQLTVTLPTGIVRSGVMCMARVDSPEYGPYGSGPVMLVARCSEEPTIATPRINGTTPLEVGTATPSFYIYGAAAGTPLPAPFTTLYAVPYPPPLAGLFWTTSLADCASLNRAWNGKSTCDEANLVVTSPSSGVCPIGTSPIYRLFQRSVVAHRYTPNTATYAALVEAGHVGEGIAWCSITIG